MFYNLVLELKHKAYNINAFGVIMKDKMVQTKNKYIQDLYNRHPT
jgi:hypothetical protein